MISSERSEYSGNYYFVSLIERGQGALCRKISLIVGLKVAVEVRDLIEGLAECVIREQARVLSEAFRYFDNSTVVNRRRLRFIHVVLQKQRIHEAVNDEGPRAARSIPSPDGNISWPGRRKWRGLEIFVPSARDMQCAGMNVAGRK